VEWNWAQITEGGKASSDELLRKDEPVSILGKPSGRVWNWEGAEIRPHFGLARRLCCGKNDPYMRNTPSARSMWIRVAFLSISIASVLAICPRTLPAQCSADSDPDSLACQDQAPLSSSKSTEETPAVFNLSGPNERQPRADLSNEATATGSLPAGSAYTERQSRDERTPAQTRSVQLPPAPPSEFQRFVAATTGQMLTIYGSGLFTNQQVTFGPVNNAPTPADLILSAADELRIRIWGQVNFSANLRINREGDIYLPKVGAVHMAGLTVAAAQDHLRQAMDRIYRNFELTVDLGEIHSIQVYIAGMARQPGEYTVSALSTLVDAVFFSGGPSSSGSMRHIQLKRDGKIVADFDLYELLVKGDKTGDRQLQPGDVLYIPPTGPQVALLGSVREPDIYELRGEETLGDLLDAAGGRTAMAVGSHISIDRIAGHAQRSAFELTDDAEGFGAKLADGDIVRVDPITSHYRDTVTLRGSVANPGHFRWRPGMHLSDLIPDRDSLVTRGYWWRRTQLGLPAPEFTAAEQLTASQAEEQTAAEFSLSKRGHAGTASIAGALKTEDEEPAGGAAGIPNPEDALPSPRGETDWDYAVIERLDRVTMATSLIPFDLGKLVLQHDASQDLALQAGDVVTIFSQDDIRLPIDRKTKYVQLDGEIANAGVYSVLPGETLRSLVERAGGLTPKAYLFGADFTRKSTQLLEQQRLNEYSERLEHLMRRSAISASGIAPANGQNNLQSTLVSANQSLIARLRQARATGRIVLNVSPYSNSANDLPEMALEDGDRLMIPSRPSTIQVIGAVFNQNAFLCAKNARVGQYLRLAGGPTREADRHQIFVLRADGSVVHRQSGNSIFDSSDLDNVRLYPGDTIVVPEKIVRPLRLRELTAWTQIMSELSLSAAALDVVK
jgi:protein involved in polysaccharide export with SLBB domain